jgi:hypothetical protein
MLKCAGDSAHYRTFVIPTEAEEWSGLGSRDIDGQAVGRVTGKGTSQSHIIVHNIGRDVSATLNPPQDGFAGANMTKEGFARA